MFFSKILVPYDGSENAQKALEKAMELASIDASISLEAIYVVTPPALSSIVDVPTNFEDVLLEAGKTIIAEAEATLASLQNKHQCYLLRGPSAAQAILDYAKEHNCDLIVMGNRGLTGIREFLGSVSHMVVQRSLVSVLIVK
jgi:nucleotide-binding universal stress UspA family protein